MRFKALGRPVEILLLEDAPAEIRVAHAILKDVDADIWIRVNVVTNRAEAQAFLCREAPYEHAPKPDLVLLDVRCPLTDASLLPEDIPVASLTGACRNPECRLPHELCQRCHVTESPGSDDYTQLMRAVKDVWQGLRCLTVAE